MSARAQQVGCTSITPSLQFMAGPTMVSGSGMSSTVKTEGQMYILLVNQQTNTFGAISFAKQSFLHRCTLDCQKCNLL